MQYSASRKISLLTFMGTRRRCRNIIACTAAEAATAAELYNIHTHNAHHHHHHHHTVYTRIYVYVCRRGLDVFVYRIQEFTDI